MIINTTFLHRAIHGAVCHSFVDCRERNLPRCLKCRWSHHARGVLHDQHESPYLVLYDTNNSDTSDVSIVLATVARCRTLQIEASLPGASEQQFDEQEGIFVDRIAAFSDSHLYVPANRNGHRKRSSLYFLVYSVWSDQNNTVCTQPTCHLLILYFCKIVQVQATEDILGTTSLARHQRNLQPFVALLLLSSSDSGTCAQSHRKTYNDRKTHLYTFFCEKSVQNSQTSTLYIDSIVSFRVLSQGTCVVGHDHTACKVSETRLGGFYHGKNTHLLGGGVADRNCRFFEDSCSRSWTNRLSLAALSFLLPEEQGYSFFEWVNYSPSRQHPNYIFSPSACKAEREAC